MSRRSKERRKKSDDIAAASKSSAAAPKPAGEARGGQATSRPTANDLALRIARRHWEAGIICALLVALVFVIFGKTVGYGFVNYDDDQYVYENPDVAKGLSPEAIRWAFTHVHADNWHPLTTMVHMLDCQIYGLWAGGHHLTNVVLHAACAVLLFLMLLEMTGALWRSAFVATVFAIHPLRVESVAWVSELKDVVSGIFFVLTLWAYVRYARRPATGRWRGYAMVVVWFALGLLSKPMLVTVPFVLLLLDYWPLGRLAKLSQLPGLLREKLPLMGLSALLCVATVIAQKGNVQQIGNFPPSMRVENALVAYVAYLGKLIWPSELTVLYPLLKEGWPAWDVIEAALLLAGLTAGAIILRRKQPYLMVGWLWYLGMLVPVSGILQVGLQSYADRYTYLPQIGVCLSITWMAADWARGIEYRRAALAGVSAVVLCGLLVAACHQAAYWHDSESLWTHTIEYTRDNAVPHNNLGNVLAQQGRTDEAITQYREALRIKPDYAYAHSNLGNALLQQGRTDEAITQNREALRIKPDDVHACNNLGDALLQQGRTDEAITEYRQALQIKPDEVNAHNKLGNALLQQGKRDEAISQYREVLQINPALAEAQYNLGFALLQEGRTDEALVHLQKALELRPDNPTIQCSLAWALATAPQSTIRDGTRALELASKANQSTGGANLQILRTLAAAYAETGDFANAVQTAQRALQLAVAQSNTQVSEALRREIKLYEAGHRFEEAH